MSSLESKVLCVREQIDDKQLDARKTQKKKDTPIEKAADFPFKIPCLTPFPFLWNPLINTVPAHNTVRFNVQAQNKHGGPEPGDKVGPISRLRSRPFAWSGPQLLTEHQRLHPINLDRTRFEMGSA